MSQCAFNQSGVDLPKLAMIEGIALSNEDILRLSLLAENGDAGSASRLGRHFSLVEYKPEKAAYWFQKAAKHGGTKEMRECASFKKSELE